MNKGRALNGVFVSANLRVDSRPFLMIVVIDMAVYPLNYFLLTFHYEV